MINNVRTNTAVSSHASFFAFHLHFACCSLA